MAKAERAFITAVLREYHSFLMEQVSVNNMDVTDWLDRNPGEFPDARQRESGA